MTATSVPTSPKWVGAWGVAPTNLTDTGGSEQTYRFLIYPTVGGTKERLKFSNFYGTAPVTIGAGRLSIGKDGSPSIDAANDVKLTFNGGSTSVTIQPGQTVVSDTVNLTYSYGQTLAVSMYLRGTFPSLSRHNALFNQNYQNASSAGDATTDVTGAAFTESQADWLLLSGMDVYGPYQGTVVLFGSSTTDGFHSNYGHTQSYPAQNAPVVGQHTSRISDWLAKALNANGYQIGVLNEGIPGNMITDPSSTNTNPLPSGVRRFSRDVVAQSNVIAVVSYFGAIDLRSSDCTSANAIEAATQNLITAAGAAKLPLFLATLPPSAFCTNPAQPYYGLIPTPADPYAGGETGSVNGSEQQRIAFNQWIRSTGAGLAGVAGIADIDKALADPARQDFMLPLYNSGDNYHPNGAGYQAAAGAIPTHLFIPLP
ncbi:GDSL-type esterase/lipase family protein [Granulicella arctica]|uniref:GDSL-type esterase/lipase family protein n=1 Tax=Granulicella arctica TaxID=940613 RepID=UPI0021DFBC0E|nr:GDSL-type esterase/lipase family protein [Granulicella arctica]